VTIPTQTYDVDFCPNLHVRGDSEGYTTGVLYYFDYEFPIGDKLGYTIQWDVVYGAFDLGLLTRQEIKAINSAWNNRVQFEPYAQHAMECYEIRGLMNPNDIYNCVSGRIPGWICPAARNR
jgi:hypothetical protein